MTAAEIAADVAVAGGGNAALCAALAAAEAGADVAVLEAAPREEAGGNSWFTDGAMRFAFSDFPRLRALLRLSDKEAAAVDVPPYPAAAYLSDLRAAGGAEDKLLRTLAARSFDAMRWLRDNGVGLELIVDNQSHCGGGGRRRFFGNLNVRARGRGVGLVAALRDRCLRAGVKIYYGARAQRLRMQNGRCSGVFVRTESGETLFRAGATTLACGGFEANEEMRAAYLGEEWRGVRVRGTRHNNGDGIQMALAAGAGRAGDWKRCHAVGTDFNSPPAGDFSLPGDIWKKHSYPYGILVNRRGERFVDEGADLRNYTYAKYGREILKQPGALVWQIFDAQTEPLLRSEYRHERAARYEAASHEELAAMLDIDRPRFLATLREFNRAASRCDVAFNPAVKDGKSARGLPVVKSNWAVPLNRPPYLAFPAVCGVTFTFGGVKADARAQVLREDGAAIPGLFAAGEMLGGIFGGNYPGGSGLMSGTVFGRIAGGSAAAFARGG